MITHSHMDHIGALPELKARLKVPVAVHRLDMKGSPVRPEILLEDGQEVSFGNVRLKVLHTPGHTPGSLSFLIGKQLLSGDTLFPHGPGRTGSPADLKRIIGSITGKLFVLPDDTEVYPGHGDSTILGREKKEFAVFSARSHDPGLRGRRPLAFIVIAAKRSLFYLRYHNISTLWKPSAREKFSPSANDLALSLSLFSSSPGGICPT